MYDEYRITSILGGMCVVDVVWRSRSVWFRVPAYSRCSCGHRHWRWRYLGGLERDRDGRWACRVWSW